MNIVVFGGECPNCLDASMPRSLGGTQDGGWALRMEVLVVLDRFEAEVPDVTW